MSVLQIGGGWVCVDGCVLVREGWGKAGRLEERGEENPARELPCLKCVLFVTQVVVSWHLRLSL